MGVVYFREGSHTRDPRRAIKEQILFLDIGAVLRRVRPAAAGRPEVTHDYRRSFAVPRFDGRADASLARYLGSQGIVRGRPAAAGRTLRAMENCTRSSVRSLLFNRLVCGLLCPLICEMTHSTRTFSNRP